MSSVARFSVLLCTIVVLVVAACSEVPATPTELPTVAPIATMGATVVLSPDEVDWDDRAVFRDGLIDAEQSILNDLAGATVYHLDLLIPDDFVILEGHEEVFYTNREGKPLNEVYFRLFPNTSGGKATVSKVAVDGQTVDGQYEFEESAFRVPLPVALEPGEGVMIEMDFEVELPREMGGNYGLFGYFDEILALDEFYPAIPVYDDEGWNVEVPPPAGDLTYFDASFYLVQVTAPTDLVVVATGIRVGQELQEGKQILTFAAGPARDFYIAASNRYTVLSERVGETTINSYAFPEYQEHAQLALQYAVEAMESFNERFGAYPYVEFDVASTPMQAIGIEYPCVVGIGLDLYDPGRRYRGCHLRCCSRAEWLTR